MGYKKRKTKRFRPSKKAQQNMNLDIEAISGGSYKLKRILKRRKTQKFKSSLKTQKNMNLDIQEIS
jgi:hypothetical protein